MWCSEAQLATFEGLPAYKVTRSATVAGAHQDPADWPKQAAKPGADVAAFEALPASGWLELGAIYLYDGTAYIVRQAHNRTEHPPADVPALFMVHRMDATSLLEWVAGEQVYVGTRRTYGGKEYECLQGHVTQADWTPPAVGALWREVVAEPEGPLPWVQPTGAHDAYQLGAQVTYGGFTWQSTINANVWAPGVYGWVKV